MVLQALTDPRIWAEVLHGPTPIIFGAGYGLGEASPHLGFFIKGEQSADYIKSLTFEK